MGDLESLLLVLVALYLAECLVWLRRGTVGFVNVWGLRRTRWFLRHPGGTLANQRGAVTFANPLPPLGTIFFGQPAPLSLSAEAAFAYGEMVDDWFESGEPALRAKEEEILAQARLGVETIREEVASLTDVVEIVRWYQSIGPVHGMMLDH